MPRSSKLSSTWNAIEISVERREPMRILVLTHNYPRFESDPAGAFIRYLCLGLERAGHELMVLTPHVARTPAGDTTDGKTVVRRVRYGPDRLETVAYGADVTTKGLTNPVRLMMLPAFLWRFAAEARRACKEFQPDVVHAHWWFPSGWVAAGLHRPFVTTSHGSDVRLLEKNGLFKRLGTRTLKRASGVTAVSAFLGEDITRLTGVAGVVPTYMPFAMDRLRAARSTERTDRRVLFAGNLVASKGVDVLLRACARMARADVEFELRIVGEGPEENRLRTMAKELDLNAVSWSPFVPHDKLVDEYERASVVVLPSRGNAEGLGLVLAEALVAGCGVVATPAGGIPEVVEDGVTGLLVDDGDAEDLAAALQRMLEDSALRGRLSAAGAARVEARHGMETATLAVESVLARAAGQ